MSFMTVSTSSLPGLLLVCLAAQVVAGGTGDSGFTAAPSPDPQQLSVLLTNIQALNLSTRCEPSVSSWGDNPNMLPWQGIKTQGNNEIVEIHLPSAGLCGPIPSASFTQLSALSSLDLSRNQFSGTLPVQFASLSQLTKLDLCHNSFTGSLPVEWSSLTNLVALNISHNRFTGPLPPQWSNLAKLRWLDMANNSITGGLPDVYSSLTQLSALDLSTNSLNGTLPDAWHSVGFELNTLYLANNSLSGTLPSSWHSFSKLRSLYLSNNSLYGTVPASWNETFWPQLGFVDLSSNFFSGRLPAVPDEVLLFNMSNNSFTGSLTKFPPSAVYLHLGTNQLTGSIPSINSTWLTYINLENNDFTSLPNEVTAPNLVVAILSNNSIQGTIPAEMYLPRLLFADMSNNQLTGTVPHNWPQKLLYLSLHHNRLQGSLPDPWQGQIDTLLLQNNNITGCLPNTWLHNDTINILSLSGNPLRCASGLPRSWGGHKVFSKLQLLDLDDTDIGGVIPEQWLHDSAFPGMKDMRMGKLWAASAQLSMRWRRDVCISEKLHSKAKDIVTSVLPATVLHDLQETIKQALTTGQAFQEAMAKLANTTYPSDKVFTAPAVNLALKNSDQASVFQSVCINKNAPLIVASLLVGVTVILLFMVMVYRLECRYECVSYVVTRVAAVAASLHCGSRTADVCGNGQQTVGQQRVMTAAITSYNLFRLLIYWFDFVTDLVLIYKVWGHWPGYALLGVFSVHYVVSAVVLAWRLGQLGHVRGAIGSIVLLPMMPVLDTVMFLVLACQPGGIIPPQVPVGACVNQCSRGMKLRLLAIDWHRLFRMRDVLEVLLEALPTAILQSIVFVMGNNPHTGWFIRTSLYVVSAITSSGQIIMLTWGVLLHAWWYKVSTVQALWAMASYMGDEKVSVTSSTVQLVVQNGHTPAHAAHVQDHMEAQDDVEDGAAMARMAMLPIISGNNANARRLLDLL